ncbi:hypothetical protein MMC20_003103 [Loxospora ochrophaea]|nr:hypothetical protein [Loxospora ochrophaea]
MEIDAARAINANKADADAQIEKYEELVKELKAEIKKLKKKNAQLTLRIASWTKAVRPNDDPPQNDVKLRSLAKAAADQAEAEEDDKLPSASANGDDEETRKRGRELLGAEKKPKHFKTQDNDVPGAN